MNDIMVYLSQLGKPGSGYVCYIIVCVVHFTGSIHHVEVSWSDVDPGGRNRR